MFHDWMHAKKELVKSLMTRVELEQDTTILSELL